MVFFFMEKKAFLVLLHLPRFQRIRLIASEQVVSGNFRVLSSKSDALVWCSVSCSQFFVARTVRGLGWTVWGWLGLGLAMEYSPSLKACTPLMEAFDSNFGRIGVEYKEFSLFGDGLPVLETGLRLVFHFLTLSVFWLLFILVGLEFWRLRVALRNKGSCSLFLIRYDGY